MSKIEEVMDAVLDALIESGGVWTGAWGQVLTSLATAANGGEPVLVGETRYHQTCTVVVRLEAMELVVVDRYYETKSAKANVVTKISLA